MSEPTGQLVLGQSAPATGDPAIDAALAALSAVTAEDLDAAIGAAERVQRTLAERLSGLPGG